MITKCDKYWWHLNKVYIIVLLCTLPVALLFPVMSFIMPILILFGSCDRFFVLHSSGEKQDDSMRFILSMPFSREQIFDTYIKGLVSTSLGYVIVVGLIRLVLSLTRLSYVFFWSDNINNVYGLVTYMAILITCLLFVSFFLISLINWYITTSKANYLSLSIFLVTPMLCVLQFTKDILIFATGMTRTQMIDGDKLVEVTELGIPEEIAVILSYIVYLIVIILFLYVIFSIAKKQRKYYVEGVSR